MKTSPDGQLPGNRPFKMFFRLVEMVSLGAEISREVLHFFICVKRKLVILCGNLCIFNDQLSQSYGIEIESKAFW